MARIFKLKSKQEFKNSNLSDIFPGDLVWIKYKSPYEIGIHAAQGLTLMRLNPEEAKNREISGVVSYNNVTNPPLKTRIIEIVTYSSPSMPGRERKITFLEDEIIQIRKINE